MKKKSIKLVGATLLFLVTLVVGSSSAFARDIGVQVIPVEAYFKSGQIQPLLGTTTASWSTTWAGGNGKYTMRFDYGDGSAYYTYSGNGTTSNFSHKYNTTVDRRYNTELLVTSGGSSDRATGYVNIYLP